MPQAWLHKLLTLLDERRQVTRAEIVRATRLNVASVGQAVRYLLERGVCSTAGNCARRRGAGPTS